MLTDQKVKNAVRADRGYKLPDSGGLHLFVTPTGTKSWRLKYRFGGKERRIVFGQYPEVSLKEARVMRDEVKRALRDGRDPALEAQRAKITRRVGNQNQFEQIARRWHETQKDRWKPVHASDVITSMERDLFPAIGAYPVDQIDEVLLLGALRAVEGRGAIETAHRLRQRAERVFKFAASEGIRNSNPAANVKEALKVVPPSRRWPALLELDDVRALLRSVDRAAASPVTRLASRFLALVAQRPGMVRHAEWKEIRNVDWSDPVTSSPEAVWVIPPGKMKLELELRDDEAFEHRVPLTDQAVAVLRAVRTLTGRGPLIFGSAGDARKAISENAIGYLYNREGWKGRHVPHGWRSSFSTIMNQRMERAFPGQERLLIDRLIIDLMLAHHPAGMSATELRYNRARYMERRRELLEDWASLIITPGAEPAESLLNGPRRRRK
jgi:hypothetical protein